jgi:hypothetical protein
MYIPYLPYEMFETLNATVPYLIGINSNICEEVFK